MLRALPDLPHVFTRTLSVYLQKDSRLTAAAGAGEGLGEYTSSFCDTELGSCLALFRSKSGILSEASVLLEYVMR